MSYYAVPGEDVDLIKGEHERNTAAELPYLSAVRRKNWEWFDRLFKILTLVLLAVLCILLILDLALRRTKQSELSLDEWSLQREYGSDSRYMSLDHRYDELWQEEMDPRNALVYLSSEAASDHPEVGSISMLHQLHCLTSFRQALQRATEGEDIGKDWRDDVHWPHCLHYLRESILCSADGTVERGPIINGTRSKGIDGAHDLRSCRDSNALFELRMRQGVLVSSKDDSKSP